MAMIDMSGQPRSDEELQEAIGCVKTIMVKHATVLPFFTVHALLILNCLEELQTLRALRKPKSPGTLCKTCTEYDKCDMRDASEYCGAYKERV